MKLFQKGTTLNKIITTTLATGIALSIFANPTFAADDDDDESENPRPGWYEATFSFIEMLEMKKAQQESFNRIGISSIDDLYTSREVMKPQFINDFRNYKENVKYYKSWSKFKRVSDNIWVGKAGGSISSTKEVSFGTTISGDVRGLNMGAEVSKTSSVGYTINAEPKTRSYMGYRVRYKVEEGENHYVDIALGKIISKKKYKKKTPLHGEYKLIEVK